LEFQFSSNESDIAVFAEFLRAIARLPKLKCLGSRVEVHVEGEPWVSPGLFPPSLLALELQSSHRFTDKWTLLNALAEQVPQLEVLRVDSGGLGTGGETETASVPRRVCLVQRHGGRLCAGH
jgi:hypothetical protein